jgi:hypothetical protein
METSEYESFVQWLPREMIEDVNSIVTIEDESKDEGMMRVQMMSMKKIGV